MSIGKSHEGRDMRVIQIAKAGPGAPNVWIEAGIHARYLSQTVMNYEYLNRLDGRYVYNNVSYIMEYSELSIKRTGCNKRTGWSKKFF